MIWKRWSVNAAVVAATKLEIRHTECFFIAKVLNVDSIRKYAEI